MKAMQVSSSEISADLLQKIQVPLDDVPGDMVTPQQYSTPLKKSGSLPSYVYTTCIIGEWRIYVCSYVYMFRAT